MTCRFMHKLCGADCDNHVCRAFFPEKQPTIQKTSKDICQGEEYDTECLIYIEGVAYQEDKRARGLKVKCPFAQNNRCGRPWEWWCKGGYAPFLLNPFEVKEGTEDIPVRDMDRNIRFLEVDYDIHESCLTGDASIYTTCPNYKAGVEVRELSRKLNSQEKQ